MQDEARCAAKEAAAAAAGWNPYVDEGSSPDSSASVPVGTQGAMQQQQQQQLQQQHEAHGSSGSGSSSSRRSMGSVSQGGSDAAAMVVSLGPGESVDDIDQGEGDEGDWEIDLEDLDGLEDELTKVGSSRVVQFVVELNNPEFRKHRL
jgi:hypothetical protein